MYPFLCSPKFSMRMDAPAKSGRFAIAAAAPAISASAWCWAARMRETPLTAENLRHAVWMDREDACLCNWTRIASHSCLTAFNTLRFVLLV